MKTFKVDAEIAISEAVTSDISVSFEAENIELALEQAKELLRDLLNKDFSFTIYRIDEIVIEEEDDEV